jgi:hypothetical protein
MNTLKIESKLAEKYGYKPLPGALSKKYRGFFTENIPEFLKTGGDNTGLGTLKGTLICSGYRRIVVGDYGAFIEFDDSLANSSGFIVKPGQEYRVGDSRYSRNVKYEWYTIDDGSGIKIYKQKNCVAYADYLSSMYYVSVHEVMLGKILMERRRLIREGLR